MNKDFWIQMEKQWRQVISKEAIIMSCIKIEKDMDAIYKKQPVKNIWECLDDEEDDDDDF